MRSRILICWSRSMAVAVLRGWVETGPEEFCEELGGRLVVAPTMERPEGDWAVSDSVGAVELAAGVSLVLELRTTKLHQLQVQPHPLSPRSLVLNRETHPASFSFASSISSSLTRSRAVSRSKMTSPSSSASSS